jgi:hypothetical protein
MIRCPFIRLLVQPGGRCFFRNVDIFHGESVLCHPFLPFQEGLAQIRDIYYKKHYRESSSAPIRVFSPIGKGPVV